MSNIYNVVDELTLSKRYLYLKLYYRNATRIHKGKNYTSILSTNNNIVPADFTTMFQGKKIIPSIDLNVCFLYE